MSRTNSQVSIEFIMIFFIFILFTSVILIMYVSKNQDLIYRRASIEAQSLLNDIVTTINTAVIRGDGFSMELQLPESVYQSNYSVIINGSWVHLNVTGYNLFVFKSIFSGNITGDFVHGGNVIKNVGGIIFIE